MATKDTQEWRIKITGLPPKISSADLAKELKVSEEQVRVPDYQNDPHHSYAWVAGFDTEEQADEFSKRCAAMLVFRRKIKCTVSENIRSRGKALNPIRKNEGFNTDDINRETHQRTRDNSYSSTSSIRSEPKTCRYGLACYNEHCWFKHPSGWSVCENQARCENFYCTASHHLARKSKCTHGDACEDNQCNLLHPDRQGKQTDESLPSTNQKPCQYGNRCFNKACRYQHPVDRHLCSRGVECLELECLDVHAPGRPVKCREGIECENIDCSRLHPREWNPSETAAIRLQNLKSLEKRMSERVSAGLPILASRTEFCERLEREKVLIVTAETGSGKSTQLPQYAAEYFKDGLVVCTQPRVVAAISLARRVADEYDGTSEGKSVGYQVGSSMGKNNRVQGTNIIFMTDAALIHESQIDSNLSRVRVLIIDEAHERSLNTDIVLGIAKLLLEKRPNNFFVVIASATIDPTRFLTFFNRASNQPLCVRGRVFDVTDEYLPAPQGCTDQKLIESHIVPTVLQLFPNHQGHTLVFLSGQREIEQALKLFNRNIPERCVALPLYGSLSPEDQDRVLKFDDDNSQQRMVVFCTNVAETSLTIKNTRLVIDSGLAKEARFDVHRRLTIVETVRISKSSANQRKGRAGRTAKGHCVRLYNAHDLTRDNIEPEILRSSLDLIVLQLVRLGLNPCQFPFMDAPNPQIVRSSLDLLTRLSCIQNETTSTLRGQLFAELALDPRLSAFIVNTYTDIAGERLLDLTATIVAILSAPGSLFYMGGSNKEEKEEARGRVAIGASEYESDLLYFCSVHKRWKDAGRVDPTTKICSTCKKTIAQRFDTCRSCRAQYANLNGLNNKVLQMIDSSSELYMKVVKNPRWKLNPAILQNQNLNEQEIIGEQLTKLFPEQLGHLLVSHLPNDGVRLISNELRARINDTSVYAQRLHDRDHQHFVTMSVTQLSSGDYVIDRLHPVSSETVPAISMASVCAFENIGWLINNEVRKWFDESRSETWAKWLVYEYDRRLCRLGIWGMQQDKKELTDRFSGIVRDVKSRLDRVTHSKECGPILALFYNGLVCSRIENMNNTLRLDLQHVPCRNIRELAEWLQQNLGVGFRRDIKENNFQVCGSENTDDEYEAPPFYLIFKSTDIFTASAARLPRHNVCPHSTAQVSTTGLRSTEKDTWGRQILITTIRGNGLITADALKQRLTPYVVGCCEYGKKTRPVQPGLRVSNLPVNISEAYIRQILGSIHPTMVLLQPTHSDGTGSLSINIFFNTEQERQQAQIILYSTVCQRPVSIIIRTKKSQQLVQKTVTPIVTDLVPKESPAQTFLLTATNREGAVRLYSEILPRLEPTWTIDSTATVTVTDSDLYPNFDQLVASVALQCGTQVKQHTMEQKNRTNTSDQRCIFTSAPPIKTALAASMLAQATSPIVIKLSDERQKRLFQELFDQHLIQTWCQNLHLKITEKNKGRTVLEIRGSQVQQGQLMRQVADYSDQFDQRYRMFQLSAAVDNLIGRQKTASVKLDQITERWVDRGCTVTYLKRTSSIIIYARPNTNPTELDLCEKEVDQLLTELTDRNNVILEQGECVFCRQISSNIRKLRLCGHGYCRCASSLLPVAYPLVCPHRSCSTNIHFDDLQDMFSDGNEFIQLCKRSLQAYLQTNAHTEDRSYCPSDNCEGLVRKSAGYQMCLTCGRIVCPLCHIIDDDLHEGRSCAEREKLLSQMGEFLPRLFKVAEKYAHEKWTPELPPIIRLDYNQFLIEQCPSLQRFYRATEILGHHPPPDLARGIFAFHGTSSTAIEPICRDGFDPNRRRGQVHGAGEYFGVTAAISDGYSHSTSAIEVKTMLVALILRSNQLHTVEGFCHVVNNPKDWSYAYNLPVLVISYGHQKSAPTIFPTQQQRISTVETNHWHPPFRWHWQDDRRQFIPYTDAVNLVLENHFERFRVHRGSAVVVTEPIIRYVDDQPQTYRIDFNSSMQTNTKSGYTRAIQRVIVPATASNVWFFENEHGQWTRFQSLIQDRIEHAYQSYATLAGPSTIDVQFSGRPEVYEINFRNGTQMNKITGVLRKIKRQ